jgi:hypothetical protein
MSMQATLTISGADAGATNHICIAAPIRTEEIALDKECAERLRSNVTRIRTDRGRGILQQPIGCKDLMSAWLAEVGRPQWKVPLNDGSPPAALAHFLLLEADTFGAENPEMASLE